MPLRLYKLVVPSHHIDDFVDFSKTEVKACLLPFAKPNGIRFFQASNSPLTFFLKLWWESPEATVRFDQSTAVKELLNRLQNFIAERLVYWDLVILDDDYSEDAPVYFDGKAYMRLSKVSVSPGLSSEMIKMFEYYTNTFTRKQRGCLSVKLLKSTNVPTTYFIFMLWSDESDFLTFSRTDEYKELRQSSLSFLEGRVEVWNVKLLAPGDNVYKVLGGVLEE